MPELPQLSPIASQPLSVVLLARNSANYLEAVLAGWVTFLNGLDREWELILVDDGSTDDGGALADKLAMGYQRVRVLRHTAPLGEGAALRSALAVASQPLLFYTLCDPHYQPADLGRLLHKRTDPQKEEWELDRVHLLSGSRGGQSAPWLFRFAGSIGRIFCRLLFGQMPERRPGWLGWRRQMARLLARAMFGIRYNDLACPFRLQRREIFSHFRLQSDGPFVHIEILAKSNYLGHIMGEEVRLDLGHYPTLEDSRTSEERRQLLADVQRVIRNPDFRSSVLLPSSARLPALASGGE
jgi:glycosyltransferase involved in cell wall biosynthesis